MNWHAFIARCVAFLTCCCHFHVTNSAALPSRHFPKNSTFVLRDLDFVAFCSIRSIGLCDFDNQSALSLDCAVQMFSHICACVRACMYALCDASICSLCNISRLPIMHCSNSWTKTLLQVCTAVHKVTDKDNVCTVTCITWTAVYSCIMP